MKELGSFRSWDPECVGFVDMVALHYTGQSPAVEVYL